jgi:hypothetical protein
MWVAVWYIFCLLIILLVWVLVIRILHQRRQRLDIRVLNSNGQAAAGIDVYGYYYTRIFQKTFAGTYGGQQVIAAEPETYNKRRFIGRTDADGYMRKTFWLHHFHTLEFIGPEGNIVQRKGDKLLLNPQMASSTGPILVYLP